MWAVYRKEMRTYLISPIPYVLVIIIAAFSAWFFFLAGGFFVRRTASLEEFFSVLPWVFLLVVPAITMRLWSEEARGGTLETLMTSPMRAGEIVLGKFLSAWTLLGLCLLATLPIPITVAALGDLDWGPVWGGYLGAMLMGGALLALGLWISSLTSHQIVAFMLTAVCAFVLVMLTGMATQIGGDLGAFLERLSVRAHYLPMSRGVLDLRDLLYFVSFGIFFLYLTTLAVQSRRYR